MQARDLIRVRKVDKILPVTRSSPYHVNHLDWILVAVVEVADDSELKVNVIMRIELGFLGRDDHGDNHDAGANSLRVPSRCQGARILVT